MRRLALTTAPSSLLLRIGFGCMFALALEACGAPDPNASDRAPLADKWFNRAKAAYRTGDLDDASTAIEGALKASPKDQETRLLGARIAMAKLEYTEALKLTEGLAGSDARGLRGRAYWYAGDIEKAADELEEMLRDPAVKDTWAKEVAKLARRGQGRHPFAIEGANVAAVEMPQAGPALVVPCELEGERILALVSTAMGEFMVDSSTRKEPAWVNLRFGDKLEIKDVPALTTDLSGISRQLGAPIKALIGVNALRHMHATFDRRGSQFVVRRGEPAEPPNASKVALFYARGGGMMMRAAVSTKEEGQALLFVDSSAFYPLALDDATLKNSGANLASFQSQPGAPAASKMGTLPYFKIGTLDLPQVPAMQGAALSEYKGNFDVELSGVVGAGLLSALRVTFGDGGRALWLEVDPSVMGGQSGTGPTEEPRRDAPLAPTSGSPGKVGPTPAGRAAPPSQGAGSSPPPAGPPKPSVKTESKGAAK